jgi:hypothetical protein
VIEEEDSDFSEPPRAALKERRFTSPSAEHPAKRHKVPASVTRSFRAEKAPQQPTFKQKTDLYLREIQRSSLKTPFDDEPFLNTLRNQLIRAHAHTLWELYLKFEDFRRKNPHYKDPEWFLEKASIDLYIFSDELKGLSNLSNKEKKRTASLCEKPFVHLEDGPFCNFQDPRKKLSLSERISE